MASAPRPAGNHPDVRSQIGVRDVSTKPSAVPTTYKGIQFRSMLEANWAASLDHFRIEWEYEPEYTVLSSGVVYLPDFVLPELQTVIESKGPGIPRTEKPVALAAENPDLIVLLGYPPVQKSVVTRLWDPYIQWRDAAGYDTRLALCPHCSAWQWLRAELSRRCRKCGLMHYGLLAKPGEMPFTIAEPDRPSWMAGL